MGALARMLREALVLHVEQWRPCPSCKGFGERHEALRAPDGQVPVRRVMARVQCDTCKSKGRLLVGEEATERGVTRVWEGGRLVGERRR